MIHFFFIISITFMSYIVYAAYFKDLAYRHYELGFRIPGLKNVSSYILVYRILVAAFLIMLITLYILTISGVIVINY